MNNKVGTHRVVKFELKADQAFPKRAVDTLAGKLPPSSVGRPIALN